MNINEAIQFIHSVSWKGTIPGLDRIRVLLDRMGNPQDSLKFVHIAGTNGKGSTAAMLASVFIRAGYCTGLYTSPYILRFNERIQVNGNQITDDKICELAEWIKQFTDDMEEHPSEFEIVTAMGFEYFRREKCDIVICEVGMGGDWDATNIIHNTECAVITNIGLDHTQILGSTVEEIARTKAGIVKPGRPCVLYHQAPSVEAVFEEICKERCSPLCKVDFSFLNPVSASLKGQYFDWKEYKNLFLPLLGAHQLNNVCTVLSTLQVLKGRCWCITDDAIRSGLALVTWPGRFEIVCDHPLFIVDGGHNPQCLEALEDALNTYLPNKKLVFLNGCMADKDYKDMFRLLLPYAKEYVTVTPLNPRALSAEDLSNYITSELNAPATPCNTVSEGVRTAIEKAGKDGIVCACGSLYMIGDILEALEVWKHEKH